ncbi:hypothetical protein DZF91_01375, partial [Actinomadura logoneensis]
ADLDAAGPAAADLPTVMAAAGTSPHLADWRAAENAGLVALADQRVVFTHPLVAATVYRQAPAEERRRAHRGLAAVITDPARRAGHLAAAAVGYDEDIARQLEETAAGASDMVAAARALDSAPSATTRTSPGNWRRPPRAPRTWWRRRGRWTRPPTCPLPGPTASGAG